MSAIPEQVLETPEAKDHVVPAVELFGIPVKAATMQDVLSSVQNSVRTRKPLHIGVVNAAKIVNMRRNSELAEAVLQSDEIYADGISVVWASRIIGRALPERIAGIDLMHEILACPEGYKVYCLGAKQAVLDEVIRQFGKDYPHAQVVGSHHGYFGEQDEAAVARDIAESKADVLFVAITSPKKEQFMARWADEMAVPVVHGVGGSFDVVAGVVERAPESWQKLGLEWLYRVKQEPGRLWKRYLVTNTLFAFAVIGEFLRVKLARNR
tara:strand:- start:1762 stop:2562 length:801 start_codon:yes stop_codon:yes gene_type:complete